MKFFLNLLCLFLSLACTSQSQPKRETVFTLTADTLQTDTLRLVFAGDLMQHQTQINAARTAQGYNYDSCFAAVKDLIRANDLAIGNLEVTLGGKPYRGYPSFSAPDAYLYAIQEAGFNVLTTSNNHCLDRGKKGLERTIQLLDSLHIDYLGTYRNAAEKENRYPLFIEKKGFRLAFIGYTYGTNGLKPTAPNLVNYIDTTSIAQDIQKCHALHPDVIIACMHWGNEDQSLPDSRQKALANWLFKKGVHHIIGAHPHVVQPIEVHTDSITQQKHVLVYSLGNYISNMSKRRNDGGIMVHLELVKDSTTRLLHCDYSLVWTARPVQSKQKNFRVIPVSANSNWLPKEARNSLNVFTNDTRDFFRKHNLNIEERILSEKKTFKVLEY